MPDRIVVLRPKQPVRFLVDVCAALADAVNEPHGWSSSDVELLTVYGEAVTALARLQRAQLAQRSGAETHIAIIDHLIERLRQVHAGENTNPIADVIDRLHAESVRELAST